MISWSGLPKSRNSQVSLYALQYNFITVYTISSLTSTLKKIGRDHAYVRILCGVFAYEHGSKK